MIGRERFSSSFRDLSTRPYRWMDSRRSADSNATMLLVSGVVDGVISFAIVLNAANVCRNKQTCKQTNKQTTKQTTLLRNKHRSQQPRTHLKYVHDQLIHNGGVARQFACNSLRVKCWRVGLLHGVRSSRT